MDVAVWGENGHSRVNSGCPSLLDDSKKKTVARRYFQLSSAFVRKTAERAVEGRWDKIAAPPWALSNARRAC